MSTLLAPMLALALQPTTSTAVDLYVVGGESVGANTLTWEAAAELAPVVDLKGRPGWVQPSSVGEDTNIALDTYTRGGRITSPNAKSVLRLTAAALDEKLRGMMDGDPDTAFEVKDVVATGVLMVFDLGARFGVEQIRFFPRQEYLADSMKGFVLSINDGQFGADLIAKSVEKLPDKTLLTVIAQEGNNTRDTIDVRLPLQYVRYLRLESTQRFNWEIDEMQIFGRGFVPEAEYLSAPIDMNQTTLWGNLFWATESQGLAEKSRVTLRTRTGNSASPEDEPESWSSWSTPYENSGTPILSPAPRRYLQFRLDFESDGLEEAVQVDSLAFEFFRPALANSIVGEIWPQEVRVGVDTTFTYTVTVGGGNGFNRLEIATTAPVRAIHSLTIDGEAADIVDRELREDGLTIEFERLTGDRTLQVDFDTSVLRYETVFSGQLRDTTREGSLPQAVDSGDATGDLAGTDLSVRVPLGGSDLVHDVVVTPATFSPNGDGVNDETTITYDLLHLTDPVPVTLRIYDLGGTQVAALPTRPSSSGRFLQPWDGRTAQGKLLPPGTYIIQVEVDADTGNETRSSVIAITY